MSQHTFTDFAAELRQFITNSKEDPNPVASEERFNSLALRLFGHQYSANERFFNYCQSLGITPASIGSWEDIPAVPAAGFKDEALTCLPAEERTRVFLSSGTTASSPSRHYHSPESICIYESSLWPWFQAHVLPELKSPESKRSFELLALTPPPSEAPNSSLVHMLDVVRQKLGKPEMVFAGKAENAVWRIDFEHSLAVLKASQEEARPIIVLGTAFSFVHLSDHLAERGLRFRLPMGSRVMETGGYKGRAKTLAKRELHGRLAQTLGVSPEFIISEYGMSELSSQGYDCVAGQHGPRAFHFPPWARATIVSPETGLEVNDGETGLIRVLDLANVFSVMHVQTEDMGVKRERAFELLGRAVMSEQRGCSLMLG